MSIGWLNPVTLQFYRRIETANMSMRTFLTRMAPKTLAKIVRDCHQHEAVDPVSALIGWCRDHGINRADLYARYESELKNDLGLKE